MENPWKTIEKKIIYENKYGYRLRNDRVLNPSGKKGSYMVVEGKETVIIVPITTDNKVILIRQWRYPIESESLELPAGRIDNVSDSPLAAAKKELEEETGAVSNSWHQLGSYWLGNGFVKIKENIFLSLNTRNYSTAHPNEDEKISCEQIDFPTAIEKVLKGEFSDQRTMLGLLLAKEYVKKTK